MNNTNINQVIDDYLRGKLSKEAHIAFKKQLLVDHDLAEEVAITKNLYAFHYSDEWEKISTLTNEGIAYKEYLLSQDAKKIKTAINDAKNMYKHQVIIPPRKRYRWYGVAASLALLIALFFVFRSDKKTPEILYAEYSTLSDLPSLVQRNNNTDKLLANAEELFLNQHYLSAINTLEQYKHKTSPSILIYKGLCFLELNQYHKAKTTFITLQNSDFLDKDKAYWYLALTYLKQKDIANTKKTLQLIMANSYYNHEKAKNLLQQLD